MAERTFKLTLAYEGAAYAGWQRQKNEPTVQQAVEDALSRLTDSPVRIVGAGRTDAGVHALGQVASFTTDSGLPANELERALTAMLPDDIRLLQLREVDKGFNARYDALGKCYRYHVWAGRRAPLFARRYVWAAGRELDENRLKAGLEIVTGEHDFAAFRSTGSDVKSTVRTMFRAELKRSGRLYTFEFEADGFLRHMVRALVGTLIDGRGPDEMERILSSGERSAAGRTAPAEGLFMAWVEYPGHGRPISAPGPFDDVTQSTTAHIEERS